LATEWQIEPDGAGQAVRFKLRQGVPFQGDKWGAFSAKDVVHAFDDLVTHPDSESWWSWWRRIVKNIEVVNDYEVVFHVNPHATWINAISEQYQQLPIQSQAEYAANGEPTGTNPPHPGTGPYQYVERVIGSYIRFQRVPYQHWRLTPDFPELEIRYVKEPSTRLASLLTGEVHLTKLPADLEPQATSAGMKIAKNTVKGPRIFAQFLCCFYKEDGSWPVYSNVPMMNVKVRQALNKALDKNALLRAFAPEGEPMYLDYFRPDWPGWNPQWKERFTDMYGYDPAKARAILAEQGYGPNNPLPLNILLADIQHHSSGRDIGEALGSAWKAIGVDVKLLNLDQTAMNAGLRGYKFDNHITVNSTASDQIYAIEAYQTNINSPRTASRVDPKIVDFYQTELVRAMDPAKQAPLLRQLGDMAYEAFWDIPLFYVDVHMVYNPKIVAGYVFPADGMHGTYTHLDRLKAAP